MTLSEIQSDVGRKCSLLDSSGNFVDGLVSASDVTALANTRWKQLHVKYAERFPDEITIPIIKNLTADSGDYEISETGFTEFLTTYVGIKYDTTDTVFTRARKTRYKAVHKNDTDETGLSQSTPYYMEVPSRQDAVDPSTQQKIIKAIRIKPTPDTNVTNGLFIRAVELPVEMAQLTDEPYTLPLAAHSLIVDYVVADVWEIKRDWANSNEALNRAVMNDREFFQNYQPTSADEPVRMGVGKVFDPYGGR